MGDLDAFLVDRHQPRRGQHVEHTVDGRRIARPRQFVALDDAPGILRPFAQFGQGEEDGLHNGLFALFVEAAQRVFGRLGDGPFNAAGGAIALQRHHVAGTPRPRLQQGVGQQRQPPRLPAHVAQELFDQAVDERPAADARRLGDDPHHVLGLHWPQEGEVLLHRGPQLLDLGQPAHEVGAQSDEDGYLALASGRGQQVVDEPLPADVVVALGEQLLELVDDQQEPLGPGAGHQLVGLAAQRLRVGGQPGAQRIGGGQVGVVAAEGGGQLAQRVGRGGQDVDEPVAPPQPGDDPGAQQRRLAAARRAGHGQKRRRLQPGGQIVAQLLAAEEDGLVGLGVVGQALVGRLTRLRRELFQRIDADDDVAVVADLLAGVVANDDRLALDVADDGPDRGGRGGRRRGCDGSDRGGRRSRRRGGRDRRWQRGEGRAAMGAELGPGPILTTTVGTGDGIHGHTPVPAARWTGAAPVASIMATPSYLSTCDSSQAAGR